MRAQHGTRQGIAREWADSGLSRDAFAVEIGVELSHLENWLALDRLQRGSRSTPKWGTDEQPEEFELVFPGGVTLRASTSLDREKLRQVVRVLMAR